MRPAAVPSAVADVGAIRLPRIPGADLDPSAALIAAALALPGILPTHAQAQAAPEQGIFALRYYDYRDWQPGADRMSVRSPSLYALVPISATLTVEGTVLHDTMSGASPLYHDTLSGASGLGVTDYRTAGDVKVTRYLDGQSVAFAAAYSSERDFESRAASIEWRTWSDDRNRTYALGFGAAHDRIDSANDVARGRRRETYDYLAGVTQVLSATAVVESTVTWSDGRGYYSDPYKLLDARPDHRRIFTWLTRYNQYVLAVDGTARIAYRYLRDSFGDRSQMLEASWIQPFPGGFTVTPSVRYLTQNAASFYHDPPFPQGFVPDEPYTADTRLSAFGAITAGVRLAKTFGADVTVDVAVNLYRQRAGWHAGGSGSPGLAEFSARWIEVGFEKRF